MAPQLVANIVARAAHVKRLSEVCEAAPLLCRLEMTLALKAKELRRFLIAAVSIRNGAILG